MGITVAFRFPTGRYHATPWDRHVNEGEVEWPPSPWRILRAFVATWYRKVDESEFPLSHLETLVMKLAAAYPVYRLPQGTRFHTRHYMPTGKIEKGGEKKSLVLDAFVRVDPDESLIVRWPEVDLDADERALMGVLLERIGYLGRAESWVIASWADEWDGRINCYASEQSIDEQTGEALESIRLAVPKDRQAYADWRQRMIREHDLDKKRLSRADRLLLETLPDSIMGAMQLDTSVTRRQRWSRMPGMEFVTFQRPLDCLVPKPSLFKRTRRGRGSGHRVTAVRLILSGKPLPRLEDAVRIGEALRAAAVSRASTLSENGTVPWVLSGRGIPEGKTHAHAFYLPEDADGDGRIDHVLVFATAGFDQETVRTLGSIRKVGFLGREGEGWRVALEGYGKRPEQTGTVYAGSRTTWQSVTPYLRPWHSKKHFGLEEQLAKECSLMGLPELREVRALPAMQLRGRSLRPVHFHRFRSRQGLNQPDTEGTFVQLTFAEPVAGPLALGFGSHFGLGMFYPVAL